MEDKFLKKYESGAEIVVATVEHAIELAPKLREFDMLECTAMGISPLSALVLGIEESDQVYTILSPEGEAIGIFGSGVNPMFPYVWLLGSDGIRERAYEFIKDSPRIAQELVRPYGYAKNYVYAEYKDSIRWLEWMGATFDYEKVYFDEHPFYEFKITYKGDNQ